MHSLDLTNCQISGKDSHLNVQPIKGFLHLPSPQISATSKIKSPSESSINDSMWPDLNLITASDCFMYLSESNLVEISFDSGNYRYCSLLTRTSRVFGETWSLLRKLLMTFLVLSETHLLIFCAAVLEFFLKFTLKISSENSVFMHGFIGMVLSTYIRLALVSSYCDGIDRSFSL